MPVELISIQAADLVALKGRLSRASRELVGVVTEQFNLFGEEAQNVLYEETPFDQGLLRETVRYEVRNPDTKNVELVISIGNDSTRPPVVVNTLLFGRRARTIKPKRAKVLSWTSNGERVFAKEVHQPAWKPERNFLDEAWRKLAPNRRRLVYRIGSLMVDKITKGTAEEHSK